MNILDKILASVGIRLYITFKTIDIIGCVDDGSRQWIRVWNRVCVDVHDELFNAGKEDAAQIALQQIVKVPKIKIDPDAYSMEEKLATEIQNNGNC